MKAAVSGWLGTALEFMDFQLYSLGAALVFHEIFFPEQSAAMALIRQWEGEPLKSYQDIVGVWTACVGHTGPDVIPNHTYTREQCDKLLETDTGRAYAYVAKCIRQDLPVPVLAAFTSLTFNVGPGGVCGSTLQKRANAKELNAACSQILRWNRAGGKIVQGLVNRRKAEYDLCMTGVPK